MGRHCGWLALLAGVAGGADFIFIPESPPPASDKNGGGGGGWEDGMCDAIHKVNETITPLCLIPHPNPALAS